MNMVVSDQGGYGVEYLVDDGNARESRIVLP